MYTHAHLRWAETLAALGDRDALPELLRISPIGTRDRLGERALLAAAQRVLLVVGRGLRDP
jgi:cellobiose phosphorylase